MPDGTVQDSRSNVVFKLDPRNTDCYNKISSPVQWGYAKVKDPEKIPEPHRDYRWNEYVLFLNTEKVVSAKEDVIFEMREAKVTIALDGKTIERDISVAVLTGTKKCKDIPF